MQNESPMVAHATGAPTSKHELADGLMLLRASTLKIIRLQLAMERHDRRAALESIDDLVTLDRRLQVYLATMPASEEHVLLKRNVEADCSMLNLEKLTLGAEVRRRPPAPLVTVREVPNDAWAGPPNLMLEEEQPPPRRRWAWLIAIPVLASVLAASAHLVRFAEAEVWLAAAGLK